VNLNDPAFKGSGTVVTVAGDQSFTVSGLSAYADGWFALGTLTWTAGANVGRKAEVLTHVVGATDVTITLLEAPVLAIATGDTFGITAGCDKRFETCKARFANAVNFRGFPHIPGQDTVIRYAAKGDSNTGVVL
jgi:phage conserved hypothetical protein BR0599